MEFRDLQAQYERYKKEIDEAIQRVLIDANFIEGAEVKELEQQLADYVGVKHCISCANGTEALSLVLMAWGIKEGDAIFVPDFTFFASAEVVSLCDATPVFVDVCPDTFNINPQELEKAIKKTLEEGKLSPKVIIPVDLFGLPANYYEINRIARKYNLLVLEDGAQGFGGHINNKKACSFGTAATTSFFPAKPLGCYGDGGAIFTDLDELAERLMSLKVHGRGKDKYDNVRIGVNSRLDTIQAAILQVKLQAFIDHELDDVNRIAQTYQTNLHDIVETPTIPEGYYSSFAQYTIKLKNKEQRDQLQQHLKQLGIPTMVYYNKPMHTQGAFAYLQTNDGDFNVSNNLSERVLSLPMHPYLIKHELDFICHSIRNYLTKN